MSAAIVTLSIDGKFYGFIFLIYFAAVFADDYFPWGLFIWNGKIHTWIIILMWHAMHEDGEWMCDLWC